MAGSVISEVEIRRVIGGRIEGVVKADADGGTPSLMLVLSDKKLDRVTFEVAGNSEASHVFWVNIPSSVVSDGITVLELKADLNEAPLATVPIIAGQPLTHDLHSEVASLRAEVELLKKLVRAKARRS